MRKSVKLAVIILAMVGLAGMVVSAYSQEKVMQQVAIPVSGEVVFVNVEKSSIEIKVVKDAATNTYVNQTIAVLPETKITKGDAVLKLSELNAGDVVTVQYASDGSGKVESISVVVVQAVPVAK